MKWFKHETNARNTKKLIKLRRKYGSDGYAIYWFCLESIAEDLGRNNVTFELGLDAETVGMELNIDQISVEEIMGYMIKIELFEHSEATVTCLSLAKRLDKKLTRNKTIHQIIDAATKPVNVGDSPKQSDTKLDCPPLDIELDIDIEKTKTQTMVIEKGDEKLSNESSPSISKAYKKYCGNLKELPQISHEHKKLMDVFWSFNDKSMSKIISYFQKANENEYFSGKASDDFQASFSFLINLRTQRKFEKGEYEQFAKSKKLSKETKQLIESKKSEIRVYEAEILRIGLAEDGFQSELVPGKKRQIEQLHKEIEYLEAKE